MLTMYPEFVAADPAGSKIFPKYICSVKCVFSLQPTTKQHGDEGLIFIRCGLPASFAGQRSHPPITLLLVKDMEPQLSAGSRESPTSVNPNLDQHGAEVVISLHIPASLPSLP